MYKKCLTVLALAGLLSSAAGAFAENDFSCPDSPNCVSSKVKGDHSIAPLNLQGQSQKAIQTQVLKVLESWPRVKVISSDTHFIRAVVSSQVFGFKDDLTLEIHQDGHVDVKSASRTGYYDFGANRNRVEALRAALVKP